MNAESLGRLDWKQFEHLCARYLALTYPTAQIEHTPMKHDGGRDLVLTLRDPAFSSVVWAECKKHARPIGIEELGKNAVLVVNARAQKLIVLSASPVRNSARYHLGHFAATNNLVISIIDGDRLGAEISRHEGLHSDFLSTTAAAGVANGRREIGITRFLHELEFFPKKTKGGSFTLRRDEQLYVSILVRNFSDSHCDLLEVALENNQEEFKKVKLVPRLPLPSSKSSFILGPKEEQAFQFFVRFVTTSMKVDLPRVLVRYRIGSETQSITRGLGAIDLTFLRKSPLVGTDRLRLLDHDLQKLKQAVSEFSSTSILRVIGKSGTGKSRLLDEVETDLSLSGWRVIRYDGLINRDENIIRRIVLDILSIPTASSQIEKSQQHKEEAQSGRISDELRAFLGGFSIKNAGVRKVMAGTKDIFRSQGFGQKIAIAVDNVQSLSLDIIDILCEIIEWTAESDSSIFFIFCENTEIAELYTSRKLEAIFSSVEALFAEGRLSYHEFECQELSRSDAFIFLSNVLPETRLSDPLLELLVKKAGTRVLDLEMVLYLMEDMNLLEVEGSLWYIKNLAALQDFLGKLQDKTKKLIQSRFENIRNRFGSAWPATKEVLQSIGAFLGDCPMDFVAEQNVEDSIVDALLSSGLVRLNRKTESLTYYHGDIGLYIQSLPTLKPVRKNHLSTVKYLDSFGSIFDSARKEKILFFCNFKLNNVERAESHGATAMQKFADAMNYSEVAEVGEILTALLPLRDGSLKSYTCEDMKMPLERVIGIWKMYAESLIHHVNVARGLAVYEEIERFLRSTESSIGTEVRSELLHTLTNAYLHSWNYKTALQITDLHLKYRPVSQKYRFLIWNRKCVIYTATGELDRAKYFGRMALAESKEFQDSFLPSIAYSDIGHIYFNLTNNKQMVVEYFEKAAQAFSRSSERPQYRKIEVPQQSAIAHVLNDNIDEARALVAKAQWECRISQYTLFELRLLILASAIEALDANYLDGLNILSHARAKAEVFLSERARWRILSNMGSLYWLLGEKERAVDCYIVALDLISQKYNDGFSIAREQPLIRNALIMKKEVVEHKDTAARFSSAMAFLTADEIAEIAAFTPLVIVGQLGLLLS